MVLLFKNLLSCLFIILCDFINLISDLLLTRWSLNVEWVNCWNGFNCKIMVESTAAQEIDVFILFFCLDIWSLLCRITDDEHALSLKSTAELVSNTSDLFSLLDDCLLWHGVIMADSDEVIVLRPWLWLSPYSVRILICFYWHDVFLSTVFNIFKR